MPVTEIDPSDELPEELCRFRTSGSALPISLPHHRYRTGWRPPSSPTCEAAPILVALAIYRLLGRSATGPTTASSVSGRRQITEVLWNVLSPIIDSRSGEWDEPGCRIRYRYHARHSDHGRIGRPRPGVQRDGWRRARHPTTLRRQAPAGHGASGVHTRPPT